MKGRLYLAFFVVSVTLLTILMITTLRGYGAASIWTDRPDYSPSDTAVVTGSGFLSNVQVTISITRPDSTMNTIYSWTDGSGVFTCDYHLDGITGTYTVTATDRKNTAMTTFTDTMKYFTSIIGPTTTSPGQTETYTIVITNDLSSSNGAKLGSALITIPSGFTSVSISSWTASGGKIWTVSIVSGQMLLTTTQTLPVGGLDRGESVSVTFSTTAPTTTGTYEWTTEAFTDPYWAHDIFHLVGSQPTVTVAYNVHLDSVQDNGVTYNLGTMTFGGTSYSLPGDVGKVAGSYSTAFFPAEGYVFDHWAVTLGIALSSTTDNPTLVTVSGSGTLRAVYRAAPSGTVSIRITSSPVTGSGFVKVDDNPITTPTTFTWTIGSTQKLEALSPVSGGTGTQYVWTDWTDTGGQSHTYTVPDHDETVTADYKTQYYLTVNSVDSTTTVGEGWYGANTIVDFSVTSPLYYDMRKLICLGYTGDASGSGTSGSILMDDAHTVTFNWQTYWYITVISAKDTPTLSDWVVDGGSFPASVTSPVSGGSGTQYVCTGYKIDGGSLTSGPSYTFTAVHDAHTIEFFWKTQYLLTVLTNPSGLTSQPARNPGGEAGPSNGWWYDDSTGVTLTAQSVAGYNFNYWDFDGTSQGSGVNPASLSMSAPHTATAYYATVGPARYTITFYTDPASIGSITCDGVTYTNGQSGQYSAGCYSVSANAPQGWTFDHWQTTGGVIISSPAQVTGDGTITVVFKRTAAPIVVGGEWAPIMLHALNPVNALQLLASWIVLALTVTIVTSFVGFKRLKKRQS